MNGHQVNKPSGRALTLFGETLTLLQCPSAPPFFCWFDWLLTSTDTHINIQYATHSSVKSLLACWRAARSPETGDFIGLISAKSFLPLQSDEWLEMPHKAAVCTHIHAYIQIERLLLEVSITVYIYSSIFTLKVCWGINSNPQFSVHTKWPKRHRKLILIHNWQSRLILSRTTCWHFLLIRHYQQNIIIIISVITLRVRYLKMLKTLSFSLGGHS